MRRKLRKKLICNRAYFIQDVDAMTVSLEHISVMTLLERHRVMALCFFHSEVPISDGSSRETILAAFEWENIQQNKWLHFFFLSPSLPPIERQNNVSSISSSYSSFSRVWFYFLFRKKENWYRSRCHKHILASLCRIRYLMHTAWVVKNGQVTWNTAYKRPLFQHSNGTLF